MLRRALRLDLRMGWRGLPLPLIALSLVCCSCLIAVYAMAWDGTGLTFGDNLALLFAGSLPFEFRAGILFMPPLGWLFVLMLCLYLTLSFPYRDLMGVGKQLLVRENSRAAWWFSKCVWVVFTCLLGLAVIGATAAVWTLAHGQEFSLMVHDTSVVLMDVAPEKISVQQTNGVPLFVGILITMCALALVQHALALFLKPSYAFLFMVFLLIASSYAQHELLLGNYLMLLRWDGLIVDGLSAWIGAALGLLAGGFAVTLGWMRFRTMDLIDREMVA